MTPTHAVKKGTRYRYYVSRRLITGIDAGNPDRRITVSGFPPRISKRWSRTACESLFADPVEILNAIALGQA